MGPLVSERHYTGGPVQGGGACRFYLERPLEELFAVSDPRLKAPKRARLFRSVACAKCGEITAENRVRVENGGFSAWTA